MTPPPMRFVVLGHARSGSSLLIQGLRRQPGMKVHSEVFNGEAEVRAKDMVGGDRPYDPGEDGADYMSQVLFRPTPHPSISAVGFKILYEHARGSGARTAWRHLRDDVGILVVHLRRRNLLDAWVSLAVAVRTGVWRKPAGDLTPPITVEPFHAVPEQVERFFQEVGRLRAWARRVFRHHAVMEVEYERHLCRDFPGTVSRICRVLGIRSVPAKPNLVRLAQLPVEQQLLNYVELKRHFEGTEHERYFRRQSGAGATPLGLFGAERPDRRDA